MTSIELMELSRDTGFLAKVHFALFDVAKDKAPGATGDDLNFVNGILNGEVRVFNMAMGVIILNSDPANASDASLKSSVVILWNFYAPAWTARTL